MLLARVHGHATSTMKHASLRGAKLLLVQPLRSLTLEPVLALDRLGAGRGDLVIITSDGIHSWPLNEALRRKFSRTDSGTGAP